MTSPTPLTSAEALRLPLLRSRNRRAHLALAISLALLGLVLTTSVLQPTSALFSTQAPGAPQSSIRTADLPALVAVGDAVFSDGAAQFGWESPQVRPDQATEYLVHRTVAGGAVELLSDPQPVAHPDGPAGAMLFTDPLLIPAELGQCPADWVEASDPQQCTVVSETELVYQVTYTKGPWQSAEDLEITLVSP